MKFIADLHIHSRYARATSKSLDPEQLFFWRLSGCRFPGGMLNRILTLPSSAFEKWPKR